MILSNVSEVKKWLRSIQSLRAELSLKIKFYRELGEEFETVSGFEKSIAYYRDQIESLQLKLNKLLEDVEKLFNTLDENERLIMEARYINMIRWDFIELHVFYSRRQAIRVHNNALEKLVGQNVGDIYE